MPLDTVHQNVLSPDLREYKNGAHGDTLIHFHFDFIIATRRVQSNRIGWLVVNNYVVVLRFRYFFFKVYYNIILLVYYYDYFTIIWKRLRLFFFFINLIILFYYVLIFIYFFFTLAGVETFAPPTKQGDCFKNKVLIDYTYIIYLPNYVHIEKTN